MKDPSTITQAQQTRLATSAARFLRALAATSAAGFFATAFFACGPMPTAQAHDVVLNSTPGDGATVAEFPRKIVLEFSGIPKDNFNTIAVSNSDTKEILFSAEPNRDKQVLSVDVPKDIKPGPGHYLVGFQITSSDGHATRGKTTFTVAEVVTTASGQNKENHMPTAAAPTTQNQTDEGMSLAAMIGIAAAVIVGGTVLVSIIKRK